MAHRTSRSCFRNFRDGGCFRCQVIVTTRYATVEYRRKPDASYEYHQQHEDTWILEYNITDWIACAKQIPADQYLLQVLHYSVELNSSATTAAVHVVGLLVFGVGDCWFLGSGFLFLLVDKDDNGFSVWLGC